MSIESSKPSSTNPPTPARSARENLLDELESLRGLLGDSGAHTTAAGNAPPAEFELDSDLDVSIPILDDVVDAAEETDNVEGLIDLDAVFNDDEGDTSGDGGGEYKTGIHNDTTAPAANPEAQEYTGDVEIPVFKLAVDEAPTMPSARPDALSAISPIAHLADDDLAALSLPGDLLPGDSLPSDSLPGELSPSATALPGSLKPLYAAVVRASNEIIDTPRPSDDTTQTQPGNRAVTSPTGDQPSSAIATPSDYDLELLIQELVDEFIPVIEARLRQRLAELPPESIRQLAAQHLDN